MQEKLRHILIVGGADVGKSTFAGAFCKALGDVVYGECGEECMRSLAWALATRRTQEDEETVRSLAWSLATQSATGFIPDANVGANSVRSFVDWLRRHKEEPAVREVLRLHAAALELLRPQVSADENVSGLIDWLAAHKKEQSVRDALWLHGEAVTLMIGEAFVRPLAEVFRVIVGLRREREYRAYLQKFPGQLEQVILLERPGKPAGDRFDLEFFRGVARIRIDVKDDGPALSALAASVARDFKEVAK